MPREQIERSLKVLWRRIGTEGMDACSFDLSEDGCTISGSALYLERIEPAKFEYSVTCNSEWSSQAAQVSGWIGSERREFLVSRNAAGAWFANGEEIEGVHGLLDIDLGFTPATNTNAIRRLALAVGEEAETTALWLDTEDWCFKPLTQVYRRTSETELSYRSPSHDYAATLLTDHFGIVRQYPHLWSAVSAPAGDQ